MKNFQLIGLIVSSLFMLIVVSYTIYEWLDTTIPFSMNLLIISAMSVFLFGINLRNYRKHVKK